MQTRTLSLRSSKGAAATTANNLPTFCFNNSIIYEKRIIIHRLKVARMPEDAPVLIEECFEYVLPNAKLLRKIKVKRRGLMPKQHRGAEGRT